MRLDLPEVRLFANVPLIELAEATTKINRLLDTIIGYSSGGERLKEQIDSVISQQLNTRLQNDGTTLQEWTMRRNLEKPLIMDRFRRYYVFRKPIKFVLRDTDHSYASIYLLKIKSYAYRTQY